MFPFLKRALRGVRFATDAEVRTSVQKILKEIPSEEFKKTPMVKWQKRVHQCIQQNGKYFKKVLAVDENVSDSN